MLRKKFISISKMAVLTALTINTTQALPIDWHGVFGVDTTLLSNYRKIENIADNRPMSTNPGSQEIGLGTGNDKASFQSYIFRLNPHIIVNDTASFKAELTSGYGRGGRLGDDSYTDKSGTFGNALYIQNQSSSSQSLVINQAYMELYSDTATYVIGRHTTDWGLGAVYNSGKGTWDRHAFSRDGVTAKIKIGNFLVEPYWAKIDSTGSLSRNTKATEIGAGLLYDNVDRDIAFGLLYSKKNNKQGNTTANTDTGTGTGTAYALGETDVTVTDIYFKKVFGNFKLELEVPIVSGELGKVYNSTVTKVNSKSFLFETEYKVNDSWTIAFDFGSISGHSGSTDNYEAMYLNPNYQVANLLFRYNLQAVGKTSLNIYDSYMTNATYAKIAGEYKSDKWSWVAAMIWAKANETAASGTSSYNHTNNKIFTATDSQESDLGMEIDLNFDYHWNSAVKVGGSLGYLFTGEYFSFTNDPTNKNSADNAFALQLNSSVEF